MILPSDIPDFSASQYSKKNFYIL